MAAYYNEFDPFAAAWLRELIKDGLIADGVVDERSILDVDANDIREFTQCHFFAGIGGWSYAARLAGWPDDRPMWSGSPPCQPFSSAGKRKGKDDERHLWPAFFNLISKQKPPVVFGEQVVPAIRDEWFDDLRSDMEAESYATGMVVLPACSVGAFHKRDRLFYVAAMANTDDKGSQGTMLSGEQQIQEGWEGAEGYNTKDSVADSWRRSGSIMARDGAIRATPLQPEIRPMVNGLSNPVGILRGAGNAIVPQVAAEVIKAYM